MRAADDVAASASLSFAGSSLDNTKLVPGPLPTGWRPTPPVSGEQVADNFLKRIYRQCADSKATTEKGRLNYFASKSSNAIEQHRADNATLGIDKLPAPHEQGGAQKRVKMVAEAYYLGEQTFHVHPNEFFREDILMHGVGVRNAAQRGELKAAGFVEISVTFVSPSHHNVSILHGEHNGVGSVRDIFRRFGQLSNENELDGDDLRSEMKKLFENLPACLKNIAEIHRNSVADSFPPERDIIVPETINIQSIKTAGDIVQFVEDGVKGLVHWGGGSKVHVEARKKIWADKYESENRKINQILSSYCYVKFTSMDQLTTLGNKQVLGKQAKAKIDDPRASANEKITENDFIRYSIAHKTGGWHNVVEALLDVSVSSSSVS